jgi:capsular polysaccharide biosynthesis protein
MEPRDYAASVGRRWLWVIAAGLVGAIVGAISALTSPTTFTATTSVFVTPAVIDTGESLGYAAQLGRVTFPSVLALGRSSAVLDRAAAEPSVGATPQQLAGAVDVEFPSGSRLLTIAADAPTGSQAAARAAAVARALEAAAATVFRGADGQALLRMDVVTPAQTPVMASSPRRTRDTALGFAVGLVMAVLTCGLEELVRPRIRHLADVAAITDRPVLATVGLGVGTSAQPDGARLRWLLGTLDRAPAGPRRVGLLGARRELGMLLADVERADAEAPRAPEGARPEPTLVDLRQAAGSSLERPPSRVDTLVLVVALHGTTRRALTATIAAAERLALPVAGVVLHGGLPAPARWWHHLGAAVRGRTARWPASVVAGGRPDGGPGAASARWTALVALVLLGLDYPLPQRATTGLVVTVLLLPLWVSALARFRGGRLLALLTGAGLACGLLLTAWSAADHSIDPHELYATSFRLLTALGLVGVLLWSRSLLPLPWVGIAYGAGRLVMGVLLSPGTINPYKFELSIPLTILLLSLAALSRRMLVSVGALLVLAALDILNDGRSSFGFCVIAAVLVLWQARRPAARRRRVWSTVGLLGGIGVGAYYAFTELLLAGALGSQVQARTALQISRSGSLLLGGRPEWTATWALMHARPFGFGLGTVPAPADVAVATQGLAITHIPYIGDYLTNYLLAGRVELHSIVADLWSNLGPAGVLLGIAMAVLLVGAAATSLSHRELAALPAWAALTSLWFLAFGPLPSNLNDVAFTLGLVMLPVLSGEPTSASPSRADTAGPAAVGDALPV